MGTINPFGKDKIIKVETELCGRTLSLEVGRVGFRTSGSVLARYGDTVVLGSAQGFVYLHLADDEPYERTKHGNNKPLWQR